VVLAEAKEFQTDLSGHMHRFKRVADRLGGRAKDAIVKARRVAERIDAEFECVVVFRCLRPRR
jgi:hypothetical protein